MHVTLCIAIHHHILTMLLMNMILCMTFFTTCRWKRMMLKIPYELCGRCRGRCIWRRCGCCCCRRASTTGRNCGSLDTTSFRRMSYIHIFTHICTVWIYLLLLVCLHTHLIVHFGYCQNVVVQFVTCVLVTCRRSTYSFQTIYNVSSAIFPFDWNTCLSLLF